MTFERSFRDVHAVLLVLRVDSGDSLLDTCMGWGELQGLLGGVAVSVTELYF